MNKEKIWQLYMIICEINNYIYIGGTGNFKERIFNHKSYSNILTNKNPLYLAIREHGWINFKFIPLLICKSKKEMLYIESITSQYLKEYGYNLYNIKNANALTEEHKKSISKFHTGKKITEEHKIAISKAQTGKKLTEEQKEHLSITVKNNKVNTERLINLTQLKSIPIIAVDINGIETNFKSLSEAANILNIPKGNICGVLKGRQRTAHNYYFKYKP